jgi:hypothetical protein
MRRKRHKPGYQAASGGCPDIPRPERAGCDPLDWRGRSDIQSLAPGVWRSKVGLGEAAEGSGD